jgi:hypothetical protein
LRLNGERRAVEVRVEVHRGRRGVDYRAVREADLHEIPDRAPDGVQLSDAIDRREPLDPEGLARPRVVGEPDLLDPG